MNVPPTGAAPTIGGQAYAAAAEHADSLQLSGQGASAAGCGGEVHEADEHAVLPNTYPSSATPGHWANYFPLKPQNRPTLIPTRLLHVPSYLAEEHLDLKICCEQGIELQVEADGVLTPAMFRATLSIYHNSYGHKYYRVGGTRTLFKEYQDWVLMAWCCTSPTRLVLILSSQPQAKPGKRASTDDVQEQATQKQPSPRGRQQQQSPITGNHRQPSPRGSHQQPSPSSSQRRPLAGVSPLSILSAPLPQVDVPPPDHSVPSSPQSAPVPGLTMGQLMRCSSDTLAPRGMAGGLQPAATLQHVSMESHCSQGPMLHDPNIFPIATGSSCSIGMNVALGAIPSHGFAPPQQHIPAAGHHHQPASEWATVRQVLMTIPAPTSSIMGSHTLTSQGGAGVELYVAPDGQLLPVAPGHTMSAATAGAMHNPLPSAHVLQLSPGVVWSQTPQLFYQQPPSLLAINNRINPSVIDLRSSAHQQQQEQQQQPSAVPYQQPWQ